MQSASKVKCRKGETAIRVCISCCNDLPLICNNLQCSCQQPHFMCSTITIIGLNIKINQRGKYFQPIFLSLFKWYETQIKRLTTQLENIRTILGDQNLYLDGNILLMYQLLNKGKSSQITSSLAFDSMKMLNTEPKININTKIKQISQKLQQQSKNLQQIIHRLSQYQNCNPFLNHQKSTIIKSVIVKQENQPIISLPSITIKQTLAVKFKPQLSSTDINIVNGDTITTKTDIGWKISLIQYPVSFFGKKIQKYRFKVIKTKHRNISFGFTQISQPNKHKYLNCIKLSRQNYIINGSNAMIYRSGYTQYNDAKNFPIIKAQNVICLQYNPIKKEIVIYKQQLKSQKMIKFGINSTSDMHACIMLLDKQDQVKYIGMELINPI